MKFQYKFEKYIRISQIVKSFLMDPNIFLIIIIPTTEQYIYVYYIEIHQNYIIINQNIKYCIILLQLLMKAHKKKTIPKQKEPTQQKIQIIQIQPQKITPPNNRKIIIVLQHAGLDYSRLRKQQVLINCDDHNNFIINKLKKQPGDYRPDITHQCLLNLLDSPINKAGLLSIYITTIKNQIIEVNPKTRIPRTYQRFAPLMVQLLKKQKIKQSQSSENLLKIVKGPITNYFPERCFKIGTSTKGRLVDISSYIDKIDSDNPLVFVIGAVAKGNPCMDLDYTQQTICISKYSLSAAYALTKILIAFENKWNLL